MQDTPKMNDYEKMEQHWHILHLNHQMIRYSEMKGGMVITLFSILITLMFNGESLISEILGRSIILKILGSAFGITVGISFFYSVRAFFPRFFDKNPRSVIYYGDIFAEFENYKMYQKELLAATNDLQAMSTQVAEQIHTLSSIARAKFRNVSLSIKYFVAAIGIMFISMVTSFFV
ncbi:MAG: hypothetical protein HKN39_03990 [Flavobacteriales bacterium]|nr:hypothetical protein [Flavobacteriales bacterium]